MAIAYTKGCEQGRSPQRTAMTTAKRIAPLFLAVFCSAPAELSVALTIINDGDSLVAAVAASHDGDVIEIRSDQKFVGSLSWSGKFLTIQAGLGFHPTIKGTAYSVNPKNPNGLPAIFKIEGPSGTGGLLRGLALEPGESDGSPGSITQPAVHLGIDSRAISDVRFEESDFLGATFLRTSGHLTTSFRTSRFKAPVHVSGTGQTFADLSFIGNDFESSIDVGGTGDSRIAIRFEENLLRENAYIGGTGRHRSEAIFAGNLIKRELNVSGTGSAAVDAQLSANHFESGLYVGGLSSHQVNLIATNNLFDGSSGPEGLTAVRITGTSDAVNKVQFINNTIVGFSEGLFVGLRSSASFENMLLHNKVDVGVFINSTIANSLISDGQFAGQNGNFTATPLLSEQRMLLPGSPGIDSGSNAAANLPAIDIAGKPRLFDGDGDGIPRVDVGAFEFIVPEPSVIALSAIALSLCLRHRRKN
jgi:hypothetical protein